MAQASLRFLERVVARKKQKLGHATLTGDKLVREGSLTERELPVEAHDVQGLVFRGYGNLPHASYTLLQFGDGPNARRWLGALWPSIARGVPAARGSALQLALTHAGLEALGVTQDVMEGFARTFAIGMVDPHRSRFLGDVGESEPEHWLWGGPNTPAVHALLLLFAESAAQLDELHTQARAAFQAASITEVHHVPATPLGSTEHFGFADGISQPAIEGYHPRSSALHLVKAGEFLLGYENEYGSYTERPLLATAQDPLARLAPDVEDSQLRDLGRNGTYLVLRQLKQDVQAFRATLDELSRNADGSPNGTARELLAARMVGRWPSGASLVLAPHGDNPTYAKANEFRYHDEDRDGLKCPLGAHVRRANPRDALDPQPGTERSLQINRRHRLIRRGRPYGDALPLGAPDDGRDRGLMFVTVNANIQRQFEFVQHSWLADPRFNGFAHEADPLLGAVEGNAFEAPGNPLRTRCDGLPRFVTVVGGAYFFLPSIRALRFLAELEP